MWLKISVFFNLTLAGGLIYLALVKPSAIVTPVVVAPAPMAKVMPAPVNTNPPAAELKPFRWSQLDAKDYHDYVKNLRAIGCPEPTVRAIVTADVQAAFRQYGRELEKQLASLGAASWSIKLANADSEQALRSRLQHLPAEQVAKVNDLLGIKPVDVAVPSELAVMNSSTPTPGQVIQSQSTNVANPSAIARLLAARNKKNGSLQASGSGELGEVSPAGSGPVSPGQNPVSMPLVFQSLDPAAMKLNDSQMQVVNDLRQEFMNQIGGANANPANPAYQQNWQEAQPQVDGMLEAMIGYNAYIKLVMAKYQN